MLNAIKRITQDIVTEVDEVGWDFRYSDKVDLYRKTVFMVKT